MMRPLKRIVPIFAVVILLLQIVSSIFSPIITAQTTPPESDTQETTETETETETEEDLIEGQEILSGPFEEFYYWDMKMKDDKLSPVLIGRGGEYTEIIELENVDNLDETIDFYPLGKEWLPVRLDEPWCGKGAFLEKDGKDGFASNFYIRIPKDRSYGTVDVVGDKSDGKDTTEFLWAVIVDNSNPEEKKFVKVTPRKQQVSDKESCNYVFKESFHTFLPDIDPFNESSPNEFKGRILGKRGMKYEDWLRRFNNLRDYDSLSHSAAKQTMIHCKKFQDYDDCLIRLGEKFQKCYSRAIGYKNVGSRLQDTAPSSTTSVSPKARKFMLREDMLRGFETKGQHVWDHSIRANLGPFTTCFGGGRYAADDPLDKSFATEQQGIEFGEWIAFDAIFHEQLYPYDIEEVSDSTLPRGKSETRCSLGKMGWITCPALDFFAKITDRLFNFIRQWLVVPPLLAGDGMAAFEAWKYMRDFANIVFIILILALAIIYAAGGTLSSYNLRTVVPQLILAALLINTSFYICSFLVDVSNVAGTSLYTLIRDMTPPKSGVDEFGTWQTITTRIVYGGGGAMLAGTGMLAGLAALVPLLIISLISMIVVLLSLLLRQAAVIVLVIVSPLAFALRLLPGTKSWFEKWKTMFSQMLFLYPVIAIVFSGAYFASNILQGQAAEQGSILMAIFALAIQVIPLFITPIVMKFGGNALNSFGGAIKSAVKSPADKVNQAAKTVGQDRKDIKDIRAAHRGTRASRINPLDAVRRSRMRRDHKRNYRESELRRIQSTRIAGSRILGGVAMASGVGKKEELKRLLDEAASQSLRIKGIQIDERAETEFNHDIEKMNERMLEEAANLGDYINAAAAAQNIVDSDDYNSVAQLIDNLNNLGDSEEADFVRDAVARKLEGSEVAKKHAHLRDKENMTALREGTATNRSMRQATAQRGHYNRPEVAATESAESIATLHNDLSREQLNGFISGFEAASNRGGTSAKITPAALKAATELMTRLEPPSGSGGAS